MGMVGVVGKTGEFGSQKVHRYDEKRVDFISQQEPLPGKLISFAYLKSTH